MKIRKENLLSSWSSLQKLCLAALLVFATSMVAFAQDTATGTVTDSNGEPIIGASVIVKGTSVGASTDFDGNFSLKNVKNGATIVVSYIGCETTEVKFTGAPLSIVMKESAAALDEVVVTALGIKKESKKLGYAMSSVQSDDLSKTASPNLGAALYGKAAGVRVATAPGGATGSISITVRGLNSLTGTTQPLIVLDGVPIHNGDENNSDYWGNQRVQQNGLADINTEDIENLSILKGASATALYGSEGANGVVLITTKSGKGNKGIGVDFSASVVGDFVAFMPQYQTTYGKGLVVENRAANGDDPDGFTTIADKQGVQQAAVRNNTQYWGPRYDGRQVYYYDDTMRAYNPITTDPWKDVYRNGLSQQYNLSITKGSENGNMRFSYTFYDNKPTQYNSSHMKHSFSLNGSYKIISNVKLDYTANYIVQNVKNRPYRMSRLVTNFGGMFGPFDDVKYLREHTITKAGYRNKTYSDSKHENPDEGWAYYPSCGAVVDEYFWNILGRTQEEDLNRFIASVTPSWEIIPGLNLRSRIATDFTSNKVELREGTESSNKFGDTSGHFSLNNNRYVINYFDVMASFDRNITTKLNLSANAGWQIRKETNSASQVGTNGGLTVENWFHINASKNSPSASMVKQEFLKSAFFASLSLGWDNWAFLEGTFRSEKISTLAKGSNTYSYPSVNASVLISELLKDKRPEWLDYAKVRASYGIVGNAPEIYKATQAYDQKSVGANGWIYNQQPTAVGNNNIKPETKYEWEFGLEAKFLRNRLGFEFSFYTNKVKDQILQTTMPMSSGGNSIYMNVGELQNKGVEFSVYGTPVQTKDWTLDLRANIAWNRNKVTKLNDGVDFIQHKNWDNGSLYLRSYVGEAMGDFYGLAPATNEKGEYLIDPATGFYKLTDEWVKVGNAMPDLTGGFAASLGFKGIFLDASLDFQVGGDIFNMPYQYMMGRGAIKESLKYHDGEGAGLKYYLNADNKIVPCTDGNAPAGARVYDNGMILDGVYASGDKKGQKNETMIAGDKYCMWTYNWGGYDPADVTYYSHGVFDNSYIKVRELVLGYNFPSVVNKALHTKNLQLSVYGRNLFYIYKNLPIFDAQATDATRWYEASYIGGSSATTRSFGFTLRASF